MSADVSPVTYDIVHATRYSYSESVSVSHHLARLSPRSLPHQSCLQHTLDVEPAAAVLSTHADYFGNDATFFAMQGAHRGLTVTSRSCVSVRPRVPPQASATLPWEQAGDHGSLPLDAIEAL
ncbi:MAG TPA: transglutaminase N-terminal domain-containing protein, partial [Vicinamibacterales bacterium]|nr:transglutaminase N-terminal domain-containing protein [Vicinamibacterales bacterium]